MKKFTLLATLAVAALSNAANFDFDSYTSNTPFASGTSFTDDGITLSIFSSGGWGHITNSAIAANQGTRSIFANSNGSSASSPFNAIDFRFDQDITHAIMQVGDGGGDADGTVFVTLYDANNVQVGQLTQFLGTSGAGLEFDITTTFRRAIVDTNGTQLPHSVAAEFSLVTAAPVPEPATLLVLAPLAAILRKRKSAR